MVTYERCSELWVVRNQAKVEVRITRLGKNNLRSGDFEASLSTL